MTILSRFLVHIFTVDAQKRTIIEKARKRVQGIDKRLVKYPMYASLSNAQRVSMYPFNFWPRSRLIFTTEATRYMWAFLDGLHVVPNSLGITWLELLILFQIRPVNQSLLHEIL